MLPKIISAGALMLLLTGGALADQPHKTYAGHSNGAQPQQNLQTSSCRPAFSLPRWQRANGACAALSNDIPTANPTPYGYNDTQGSHALGSGPG